MNGTYKPSEHSCLKFYEWDKVASGWLVCIKTIIIIIIIIIIVSFM